MSLSDFKELLTDNCFINNDYVDGINQFSSRGGVVDFWPPIYQSPIRIEFFDQTIESIRIFDPSSQLTIQKLDEFSITTGSYLPMNDVGLKTFRDKWRDYFSNYDERTCDLFQDLNNNHLAEGFHHNQQVSVAIARFREVHCIIHVPPPEQAAYDASLKLLMRALSC